MCALPLEKEIEYPTSDGQPMAETTLHRKVMSDLIGGLERRYADAPDVWVGGNLFLYYREGEPDKVAPDVLLARGVEKRDRDTYLLWEEKPPALIFEITSRWTRGEDTGDKKDLYERIGVAELVLFDPYGEYLKLQRLQGYRLEQGLYRPITPNRDGSLDLRTTGVTARPEGKRLRLVDTASGEKLLWDDEIEAARRTAEKRAGEEAAARLAAEERAAVAEERARALAEELARLRREPKR